MDFQFLQNPISKKWVILAPRRSKRPDIAKGIEPVCPFCPGREGDEQELYRVRRKTQNNTQNDAESDFSVVPRTVQRSSALDSDWQVRVLNNKFPFAPIHELIIHSPDHSRNFDNLPLEHVELIFKTYRQRYNEHKEKGQVYIFHNRGENGGESLPHSHTQLAVVPNEVKMDIPRLDPSASEDVSPKPLSIDSRDGGLEPEVAAETPNFYLFCPKTSSWPDEVWIAPKKRGRIFGEITDEEVTDLSSVLPRLIKVLTLRHGNLPLPYNFHIYPGGDWYLRLTPRLKSLGGFEIGTGIFINTSDPQETIAFIKEHFENPNEEKITKEHQADYRKGA